jgi:hypothetical protein
MARRVAFFGVTLLLATGFSEAIAQPENYCANYATQMAPNNLYVVMACPNKPGAQCLVPVLSDTQIQRGVSYQFLYKTPQTDVQNSLVVIQLKGIAARPVPTPVAVKLTRQQLSFACYTKHWTYSNDSFPAPGDNDTVAYNIYDRFHRYGYAPLSERRVLLKFHTNYFNGSECVSTLEAVRRAQFLFADRPGVATFWVALSTQVGLRAPEAVAAEINQYDHLGVVIANYRKQPQASGCISFLGRSDSTALEINLSDLEEKAHTVNFVDIFKPKVWIINSP